MKSESTETKPAWIQYLRRAQEFSQITSLHGYKHIGRVGNTRGERIGWACLTVISHIVVFCLVWQAWKWYSLSPILTLIESTHHPIWNVDFPAVTICSTNKISKELLMKKANGGMLFHNLSKESILSKFHLIAYLQTMTEVNLTNDVEFQTFLNQNNWNIATLMDEIAPQCNSMLERCSWKSSITRCDSLFQRVMTSEGPCCTFNYYGTKTNRFDSKLVYSHPKIPRKVSACGFQSALSVILNSRIDDYHTTILASYGFRILVHDAFTAPDENAETKLVSPKREVFLSITPETTYATEAIRRMVPSERNCLFETETNVGMLQRYSYTNCLAQCRSDLAVQFCKCIPYTFINNGSFPVCTLRDNECLNKYRLILQGSFPGWNESMPKPTLHGKACGCLPNCEHTDYLVESSLGNMSRRFSFNSASFFKGVNVINQSVVHVYYQDLVGINYRRDISNNWHNMTASFGGLLGLFIGFSLISGFEMIYYFTIRIFFDKYANPVEQTQVKKKDPKKEIKFIQVNSVPDYGIYKKELRLKAARKK